MPSIIPTPQTLHSALGNCSIFPQRTSESPSPRSSKWADSSLYPAWSATEDAKKKAAQLSNAAAAEFEKASSKTQAKVGKIELYSAKYYAACTFGGLLACGLTHTAVTPLDLVKCRRQVDSKLYKGNFEAWGKIARAEGLRGVYTGWGPTFWGYSIQGAFKYGGYEFFKKWYADLVGAENAAKYKTGLYLVASASAELIADVGLCPLEAVKVRMQTTIPPFARTTLGGIGEIVKTEGVGG